MKKLSATFLLTFFMLSVFAQTKIRSVAELINTTDPGWPFVQQLIDSATNKIEVLACDSTKTKDALFKSQVTTRSPMGAIIYATGGILVDNGWIRILGSGNRKLNRTLSDWNKGKSFKEFGEKDSCLLVADDAVGGFFAVNGGLLGRTLARSIIFLQTD